MISEIWDFFFSSEGIADLPDLLFPYLIGISASVVLLVVTIVAFVMSERRSITYREREARLPEATRWDDLSARVEDLQIEHDELKERLFGAQSVIEESERQQERLNEIEDALRDKQRDYDDLQRVQAELTQESEQLAAAREEAARLHAEQAKAEFQRDQLHEDAARIQQRLEEQRSEAARVEDRVQELRSREEETRKALQELHDEIQSRRLEDNELGMRRAALEHDISRLQRELESLNSARDHAQQSLQGARDREAELKASIQGLVRRLDHEQGHLEAVREKIGARDPASADARHVLQELWMPAIDTKEFGDTDMVTDGRQEAEALDSVRVYLQDHGLRFPDRVLNAFHTSLKCADDTPLLVLAGISGTGKSLLPRRYSEAMGLHFLHLPVQPRWDGPQDLLGFYNYLENRYKATPLLRALLQLDRHFRSWTTREYVDASDHVLLVLLDEMNLARIEYYFSEFLSRLEMRRDVDRDDSHDVRKAEIPVEVGRVASISADDPVRVFVDSNVLFVGTMNEDESTLSLSEKVVDRANIIRFGRPQDFADLPATNANGAQHRARQALAKSDWNEWTTAEDGIQPGSDHEELIGRLNDALEHIGRPFGYRTRRAILTYLRMYPERHQDGLFNALADQIEQRILPKLRGLDIAEQSGRRAIDDVKDVIEAVGDDALLDAVERGAGPGRDLFTWSGVDRSAD